MAINQLYFAFFGFVSYFFGMNWSLFSSWLHSALFLPKISSFLRFFFETFVKPAFSLDSRTLAVFRICLGLLCLWRVGYLLPYATDFLGNDGYMPVSTLNYWPTRWSLYFLNDTAVWAKILLFITGAFSVLFTLGIKTRTSSIALWVLFVSLSARSIGIENGGHAVFRMILFWAMFLPLDRFLTYEKGFTFNTDVKEDVLVCNVATAGFLLQIILIFMYAGLTKDDSAWQIDLTAVYKTLQQGAFATSFGVWLASQWELTRFLTKVTVFLEVFTSWLLIFPFYTNYMRFFGIFLLTGLVFGFAMSFMLGIFPFVLFCWLLACVPADLFLWQKPVLRCKLKKNMTRRFIIMQVFCAGIIVLSWWNNHHNTFPETKFFMPSGVEKVVNVLRIDQRWWMFTHEEWYDFWLDTQGIDADGKTVADPWAWTRGEENVAFNLARPESFQKTLGTQLWNRYMFEVKDNALAGEWFLYTTCKKYNAVHENNPIKTIKLWETARKIEDFGVFGATKSRIINEWECD